MRHRVLLLFFWICLNTIKTYNSFVYILRDQFVTSIVMLIVVGYRRTSSTTCEWLWNKSEWLPHGHTKRLQLHPHNIATLSKRIELTVDAVMVLLLTFLCWVVGSNCHVGGCKACTQQNKFTTVHTPPKNRADDNQRYTGTGFLPTVVVVVVCTPVSYRVYVPWSTDASAVSIPLRYYF